MTQQDPLARFQGQPISYTYDNGWSFANAFDGSTRITDVPGRGVLREQIEMTELRPSLYFASWIDSEMGLIAQIIDLETVLAAIPSDDGRFQILSGKITNIED